MRDNWVLTHFYQTTERSLPLTVVYIVRKEDLREERHTITGHLKRNQIIDLLGCTYVKPEEV